MSKSHITEITCPKCHCKGEFEVWDSINADLHPDLRDKLFSNDLFLYTCPICGAHIEICYGTLYHDMTHKFMLFFDYEKSEDFDYSPLQMPEGLGMEGYTFRVVFGLSHLKEKIVILEQGLDDLVIEHMKYMTSHVIMPEIAVCCSTERKKPPRSSLSVPSISPMLTQSKRKYSPSALPWTITTSIGLPVR